MNTVLNRVELTPKLGGTSISAEALRDSIERLHRHIEAAFWNGQALIGPDSGVRFNSRIGRIIKSYFAFVRWNDSYAYMQSQAYWVLSNWLLFDLSGWLQCEEMAVACTNYVAESQTANGHWQYPNPEWKHRVATVEGDFAALALAETYARTRNQAFLDSADRWHRYLVDEVGFQGNQDQLAVEYFAGHTKGMVPNNTTLTLWVMARLKQVTKDHEYLQGSNAMLNWLAQIQESTGEFPYALPGRHGRGRQHFLCYQYNAFQFLDLAEFYEITNDEDLRPVLSLLAGFLSEGITVTGAARYDCHRDRPEVTYYTAVLGAALRRATELGLGDYAAAADRAYQRVLSLQEADGGFRFFSKGDYRILTDRRPYPRNLAMILYHLLLELSVASEQAQMTINKI